MPIRKQTILALFATISLTIFIAESTLAPIIPFPGVKLGLANVVTLMILSLDGNILDVLLVFIVRIILAAISTGSTISLAYSLAGGFLAILVMCLIHKMLGRNYLILTAVFGAISHNLAQILVAWGLMSTPAVLSYLPVLMISAVVTGLFTGFVADFVSPYLKKTGMFDALAPYQIPKKDEEK